MKTAKNPSNKPHPPGHRFAGTTITPMPAGGGINHFEIGQKQYARLLALEQKGVFVEKKLRAAIDRLAQELEGVPTEPDPVRLSDEERRRIEAEAYRLGIPANRLVQFALEKILPTVSAESFKDLPETPLLSALGMQDAPRYDVQAGKKGLFLPTPGILGEVEIPQETALSYIAEALVEAETEIMKIACCECSHVRKQLADVLLLAELVWLRDNPEWLKVTANGENETPAQLFSRWAVTGTDFEDFEKILAESKSYTRACRSREVARTPHVAA